MKARNPFLCPHIGPGVQTFVAADRIEAVKRFDAEQCRAALEVRGLQLTVRRAIERRLRALAKGQGRKP